LACLVTNWMPKAVISFVSSCCALYCVQGFIGSGGYGGQ
jgi:hypothetical protein